MLIGSLFLYLQPEDDLNESRQSVRNLEAVIPAVLKPHGLDVSQEAPEDGLQADVPLAG